MVPTAAMSAVQHLKVRVGLGPKKVQLITMYSQDFQLMDLLSKSWLSDGFYLTEHPWVLDRKGEIWLPLAILGC